MGQKFEKVSMNFFIKVTNSLVLLFSFFLSFGKYDPFGTNGIYFDALTVLLILMIAVNTKVLSTFNEFKKSLVPLLCILLMFFFCGVFYGYTKFDESTFNIKFFSAIIIFWFFSYIFSRNSKLCVKAILTYSLGCSIIALGHNLGLFAHATIIKSGRLLIFDENPNSISSRMAIALIILIYLILVNPLKWGFIRILLIFTFPSLFFFIVETGSRGSFLAIVLGIILILLFSKVNKVLKFSLIGLSIPLFFVIFVFIQNTSLSDRFQADDVSGGREQIWQNAILIFYDRPWGVGEGGYINEMFNRYSMLHDAHNLFIYLLVCGGWLSFLCFMYFLFVLSKKVFKDFKEGNSLLVIIYILLIFLAAKTGGVLTYLIMWYFFAVINGFSVPKLKY